MDQGPGGVKELRFSPAGKNLTSSVSAPFCFRAFRPGPRFSFFVGSNLRPMVLKQRKTGEGGVVATEKGTQVIGSAVLPGKKTRPAQTHARDP